MKLGQAWNSRGMRKLRRNKLAMVALAIIGAYLAVALGVMFGLVTLEDTRERALPNQTPGLFGSQSNDKRVLDATWLNDRLASGLSIASSSSQADDERRFRQLNDSVGMAERVVPIGQSFSEATAKIEAALASFELLDEALLDYEDIEDEHFAIEEEIAELEADVAAARAAEPSNADEIAELEEEIVGLREELAEVSPLLEESTAARDAALLETEAAQLEALPMPSGFGGAVYAVRTSLGGDEGGRSIAMKAIYSIKIAFQVGFVTAIVCVLLGTALGAAAAFYGGWVDYGVMFIVSVFSSIPSLVLLVVIRYIFSDSPLFDNAAERPGLALVPVYAAFCLTFWIGTCRVVRGEVMKLKELEYVQAAQAIGFGRMYILFKHVVPNTAHLMFINFSLLFIGAIKSEVILSFLNLGVKGQPSWGLMISNGKNDVTKFFFWDVLSATGFMFVLVLAFNILSDALQDAFDPKHVG
ncbi:MAG: ABC transporter permease [Planctomycetota bacterium]